jgi:putative transposase
MAAELGITEQTVGRWRRRFAEAGLAGIQKDAPRGGRRPKLRDRMVRKIIETTTRQTPNDATHGAHGRWPSSWASTR